MQIYQVGNASVNVRQYFVLQLAAVLAVLRAARGQGLINDLDEVVSDIGIAASVNTANNDEGGSSAGGSSTSGAADDAAASVAAGAAENAGKGGGDSTRGDADDTAVRVPFALLWAAVGSRHEALRVDSLQLISTSVRTSFLPGSAV